MNSFQQNRQRAAALPTEQAATRKPRATAATSQNVIRKQTKQSSNLIRKNPKAKNVGKENSNVHADQRINSGIRQKQPVLVGQKRKVITSKSRPDTASGIPNLRNRDKKHVDTKSKLVQGKIPAMFERKSGQISAANISAKKFSQEPNTSEMPTNASQRQSILTKKRYDQISNDGCRTRQEPEGAARTGHQKRQRTDNTQGVSNQNSGLTSVGTVAQNLIPQWVQTISSSITKTFSGIHESISYYTATPPDVDENQKPIERITLEPKIPLDQRLVSNNEFGFQNMDLTSRAKKSSEIFGNSTNLGFHTEVNKFSPESIIPQEEIKKNVEIKIEEVDIICKDDPFNFEQMILNNDARNDRHIDCDDILELQLQNRTKKAVTRSHIPCLRPPSDDGPLVQFPIYDDASLPFLDRETDLGLQVSKSIVAADFDDDCATDEDMQENAQKAMIRELTRGIDKYLTLKKIGSENKFVKNKDVKSRYAAAKCWDKCSEDA